MIQDKEISAAIKEAQTIALRATCARARCGTVIIKDNLIIGKGYNSPPGDKESQRRCSHNKKELDPKITDKTCCIHAEQRAILDALRHHPEKLAGSQLLFVRLNEKGTIEPAGQPYCTICSKLAFDVGIQEFILIHADKTIAYNTEEYNHRSYRYTSDKSRDSQAT